MTLKERLAQLEQGLRACVERERAAEAEMQAAREARLRQEGAVLAVGALAQEQERPGVNGREEVADGALH